MKTCLYSQRVYAVSLLWRAHTNDGGVIMLPDTHGNSIMMEVWKAANRDKRDRDKAADGRYSKEIPYRYQCPFTIMKVVNDVRAKAVWISCPCNTSIRTVGQVKKSPEVRLC